MPTTYQNVLFQLMEYHGYGTIKEATKALPDEPFEKCDLCGYWWNIKDKGGFWGIACNKKTGEHKDMKVCDVCEITSDWRAFSKICLRAFKKTKGETK